jgi:hypothetical protein
VGVPGGRCYAFTLIYGLTAIPDYQENFSTTTGRESRPARPLGQSLRAYRAAKVRAPAPCAAQGNVYVPAEQGNFVGFISWTCSLGYLLYRLIRDRGRRGVVLADNSALVDKKMSRAAITAYRVRGNREGDAGCLTISRERERIAGFLG